MARRLTPNVPSAVLAQFVEAGVLGAAEVHAAQLIAEVATGSTDTSDDNLTALAFAVWAMNRGHVCIDLDSLQNQVMTEVAPFASEERLAEFASLEWPDITALTAAITASGLVGPASEKPDLTKPLVLADGRLFLTRQWIDEGVVAGLLAERLLAPERATHPSAESWISAAIPGADQDDLQALAVRTILRHSTLLLMGGPGTGKTHTIAAMLHALAEEHDSSGNPGHLRVALAAPTAKAAQQVTSSIIEKFEKPDDENAFPVGHKDKIIEWANEADTVHRLLGVRAGNLVRFRHDARNPLPYDVIVVDEVSMVSLPLMARLLEAIPQHARLILVGDPQQLQSIETGAVLAQLEMLKADFDQIITLTKNRRQASVDKDGNSVLNQIGLLAELIRAVGTPVNGQGSVGQVESVSDVMSFVDQCRVTSQSATIGTSAGPSITWIPVEDKQVPTADTTIDVLAHDLKSFAEAAEAAARFPADDDEARRNANDALTCLSRVRVLCGHRDGPHGVSGWNDAVRAKIGLKPGLDQPGRPVLVTRNDRAVGLNNGDNGMVVTGTPSRIAFHLHKRAGESDNLPDLLDQSALTHLETSFAMTVHKSQGSQYETVVFVVPPVGSPLLQLELFYTAVTRAKSRLVIIGSEESIRQALMTPIKRASGLADRIRAAIDARGSH